MKEGLSLWHGSNLAQFERLAIQYAQEHMFRVKAWAYLNGCRVEEWMPGAYLVSPVKDPK